ncbi:MAG: hypothetical protein VX246_13990 [Myxococcota bacterium]|nr:hypothetical protein [Myxococcota bacterium]
MKWIMLCTASIASVLVLMAVLLPQGEVVTLHTRDSEGNGYSTQLWIVELGSGLYLRSGADNAGWLSRAREFPDVELSREAGDTSVLAVVVDDPVVKSALNAAMAEKYGIANRIFDWMVDIETTVAVRLDPREGSARTAPLSH